MRKNCYIYTKHIQDYFNRCDANKAKYPFNGYIFVSDVISEKSSIAGRIEKLELCFQWIYIS